MPKNKMSDLRNHLFETLEALKDEEKPMEIERALAVSTVAQTIINTVKEETRFMHAIGEAVESEFFDGPDGKLALVESNKVRRTLGR